MGEPFAPTAAALRARLDAVDPEAYARSRNAIGGAVTRLSPYLTHGFADVPAVIADLRARHPLPPQHRLVVELAWREYFRHAWRHLGDGILADVRPPPYAGRYADALPDDLLEGRTGVPAVDRAVRTLYADGWLHNHARMWLASYAVHLRKVHWRAGADWMHAQLLDGDPASNHLSWQWVAGTFSAKPYVFDAGNVERWAPRDWRSPGTAVDRSYEALDAIARGAPDVGPEPGAAGLEGVAPPPALASPPAVPGAPRLVDEATLVARVRERVSRGGVVRIVHPWSLGQPPDDAPRVALLHAPDHARLPWSAARWSFVMRGLGTLADVACVGDAGRVLAAIVADGRVPVVRASLVPGWREALAAIGGVRVEPVPLAFEDPEAFCRSFSRYWDRVSRRARIIAPR